MAFPSSEKHMPNISTAAGAPATPRRVGRKMEYPEKREAAFASGTLARVQAVLRDGETQVAFFRAAIERELQRREGA